MVGLSDIPCVGKVVDIISDAAVDALFRGFRYMFRYKNLVKILDTQVKKANTEEDRVSTAVAKELCNGKVIKHHVLEWQKEAEEIRESAKEFTEKYKNRHSWRCIQCLPIPNPVSRFQLGREAVQMTERVTELINSGKELLANEIARPAPDENLPQSNTDEFQTFLSRKVAYGELWEALVTGSSPVLGIYGMPGVGKTRMMEQIWKEAKEKNIFDKVTRGNVGNGELDVIELQKQIAEHLDCNFQSQDNVVSRASQLKQSLLKVGKTLVILDDVWREIPLHIIGIPCGDGTSSMGCKILFTSREEEVCLRNKCKNPVKITPLLEDEAWDQFRNIIGTSQINSIQDESLAKKVCKKCAGLPLLIHAVGKALQFKTLNSWVDALDQLEKGKFENIPGIDPQVYACVQLSIDKLPDDAKTCLFLCCLFPEDADIHITKLIQLATGSKLVSDGESRVLSMVDTLRSSSLLLDCEENDITKLHDLIRDVGRSIAVRDPEYAFLQVKCGLRLPDNADFRTRKFLCLDLESDNVHIPDDLVCPDLHSLWLKCNNDVQQFSGGLFSMSANLIFLYVEGKYFFSPSTLQFSLQSCGKLKTLILDGCDLTHINKTDVGLFPEYLETLCIWYCRLPEPLNLSNLKYLRKLEIKGRGRLALKFMPNTISSLSCLEELHIPNGFVIPDYGSAKIVNDSSVWKPMPILVEISQLTCLKSLQIYFERSEPFQDRNIFDNLKDFNICVGVPNGNSGHTLYSSVSFKKSIEFYGDHLESLKSLIERAEAVKLKCTDINMSSIFDSNREAFTDLRNLCIEKCDNMEHLARMSQGEIQHSQWTSFSKLTCLEIRDCSALRYLFGHSVAKCLTQLQKLRIGNCPVMEAIVMNEGSSNEDIINFSNLKELVLSGMPRLRRFYGEKKDDMIPSIQLQPLFHGMVGEIQHSQRTSFSKLTCLEIINCSALRYLFCNSVAKCLAQLQELKIRYCPVMEAIVMNEGSSNEDIINFWNLKELALSGMPRLRSFYREKKDAVIPSIRLQPLFHGMVVEFPSLENLEIGNLEDASDIWERDYDNDNSGSSFCKLKTLFVHNCDGLETVVPVDMLHKLQNLELLRITEVGKDARNTDVLLALSHMYLGGLPCLTETWFNSRNRSTAMTLYPNLKKLEIYNCNSLRNVFMHSSVARDFMHLEEIEVKECKMMTEIIGKGEQEEIMDVLVFPKLTILQLELLPNFIWCYEANARKVEFPILVNLKISSCGKINMEAIEFGRDDFTCQLNRLEISCDNEIQLPCKWQPRLYNLKTLVLSRCWWHELKSVCFQRLNWLEVHWYSGRSALFAFSHFKSLQLTYIEISNCAFLEEIVEDDEISGMNKKTITHFHLMKVVLKDLPKLKSFFRGANYECNMPALCEMEVDNCGFSTLFTCSVFKNLQQLLELKVSNCRLLEGIVEDAVGDETSDTSDNTITLPQLRRISLRRLRNLKSFSRTQSYAFNMPRLRSFALRGCPRVENFTFLNTNTGLVSVDTKWDYGKQVSDLNDYIKQNIKRGSHLCDSAGELSYK